MEFVPLELETRNTLGKLNKTRNNGYIPGILYGKDMEPVPVQIKESIFSENLRHHGINTIYQVHLKDQDMPAVIRDIQVDRLKNTCLHVDLQRISMDQEREARVPIRLVGKSRAESRDGVLSQQMEFIEVRGLPTEIPEYLEINVADMKVGDHLMVKDLLIPENLTVVNDPRELVVSLSPARPVLEDLNAKDNTPANGVPIIGNDERETKAT